MTTRLPGARGVTLAADVRGSSDGPAVVLMHGGGQTRHAWGATTERLAAQGFHVVSLDMRGHGESAWAPDADYGLDAFVDDLVAVVATLPRAPAIVGASLGGVTALLGVGEGRVAASALVLVDIVPNIDREGAAEIRAFMRANQDGFASLNEAADAVARFLPHRPRPADISGLRRNLREGRDGRLFWHWDPAYALPDRESTAYKQQPRLAAAARAVTIPTLLVKGGMSRIVTAEGVAHFRAAIPHAEFVEIHGADHMVAGDRNDAFSDAAIAFLARTLPLDSALATRGAA